MPQNLFNLPDQGINNQVFNNIGLQAAQVWSKPPGITMVYMLLIGAGSGGGGGFTGATSTLRGGGGGGGPGVMAKALVPAYFLPPQLYVYAGRGGAGGTPGQQGGDGDVTAVGYTSAPWVLSSASMTLVRTDSASPAGGGTPGTSVGGGVLGGPEVFSLTFAALCSHLLAAGPTNSAVGATAGSNGSASASSVGFNNSGLCGGAGGGGATSGNGDSNGGAIIISGGVSLMPALPLFETHLAAGIGASGGGGNGTNGIASGYYNIPLFTGGAGGGSASAGTGGNGGDGAIGCGGGGGGGGITGGSGGKGGNGLVVITCW